MLLLLFVLCGASAVSSAQQQKEKAPLPKLRFNILPEAPNLTLSAPVPANFQTCNYGFFCRQELKFEKQTALPLRFRLGSVEQCDRLEGKTK